MIRPPLKKEMNQIPTMPDQALAVGDDYCHSFLVSSLFYLLVFHALLFLLSPFCFPPLQSLFELSRSHFLSDHKEFCWRIPFLRQL